MSKLKTMLLMLAISINIIYMNSAADTKETLPDIINEGKELIIKYSNELKPVLEPILNISDKLINQIKNEKIISQLQAIFNELEKFIKEIISDSDITMKSIINALKSVDITNIDFNDILNIKSEANKFITKIKEEAEAETKSINYIDIMSKAQSFMDLKKDLENKLNKLKNSIVKINFYEEFNQLQKSISNKKIDINKLKEITQKGKELAKDINEFIDSKDLKKDSIEYKLINMIKELLNNHKRLSGQVEKFANKIKDTYNNIDKNDLFKDLKELSQNDASITGIFKIISKFYDENKETISYLLNEFKELGIFIESEVKLNKFLEENKSELKKIESKLDNLDIIQSETSNLSNLIKLGLSDQAKNLLNNILNFSTFK